MVPYSWVILTGKPGISGSALPRPFNGWFSVRGCNQGHWWAMAASVPYTLYNGRTAGWAV